MKNYVDILKKADLKATLQRTAILEIIDQYGHIGIEQLYQTIIRSHATLSLATVYKNIITMVEKGVIVEVAIMGSKPQYELKKAEHIHLICQSCGSVNDEMIDSDDLKLLKERKDFRFASSQINLYGLCKVCIDTSHTKASA